jgi:hypothetical protein
MLRYVAGVASALLLLAAGIFFWKSRAEADSPLPEAPRAEAAYSGPVIANRAASAVAPAATEKSKEEKRFGRSDKNKDGRITLVELLEPRRKAFAKLDRDGNGNLSFAEWTGKTGDKFASADADRSGWLSPREFETTKPKTRPKPKCRC